MSIILKWPSSKLRVVFYQSIFHFTRTRSNLKALRKAFTENSQCAENSRVVHIQTVYDQGKQTG